MTKLCCFDWGFRRSFNISGSDFFTDTGLAAPVSLTFHPAMSVFPVCWANRITVFLEFTVSAA